LSINYLNSIASSVALVVLYKRFYDFKVGVAWVAIYDRGIFRRVHAPDNLYDTAYSVFRIIYGLPALCMTDARLMHWKLPKAVAALR
jgi:hypothetical protein